MGVICFSSLKGGVGKTSLSVNVAHAFAKRGNQVLLIDTDPLAHASRFLLKSFQKDSPLAHLLLPEEKLLLSDSFIERLLLDYATRRGVKLIDPARENVDVISSSAALRHFYWGKGARLFGKFFPRLIEELKREYDYIVIDTAPDFNVVTRNCLALASMVVMPTDSSEMGIYALEELVSCASHIKGPIWTIARTLVSKQAKRVSGLAKKRIEEGLKTSSPDVRDNENEDRFSYFPDSNDTGLLVNMLEKEEEKSLDSIYLLNSVVYRTEEHNRLSLLRNTAFDSSKTSNLAIQYLELASELEKIFSWSQKEQLKGEELEDFKPDFKVSASFA